MSTSTSEIPWRTLDTDLGAVPFYIVQFDKQGTCTSPEALEHLLHAAESHSDVIAFSHGWNNDWKAATGRYERFLDQFVDVRRDRWPAPDRRFQPLLVGVIWPSTALVAPWERGPDIAGVDPLREDLDVLAEALTPEEETRLRAILADPAPRDATALEAAGIVAEALGAEDDEIGRSSPAPSGEELLETWKAAGPEAEPAGEAGGFIDDDTLGPGPEAAGLNPLDWVRKGIRLATVQQMKDRAGTVGGNGVAAMVRAMAAGSDARLSMVGHSYGAKVVLSAICNGPAPSRDVTSVLLLQPALSCYALTDDFEGKPGGYYSGLERVVQPIITTRSSHDGPLTKYFHLAVRRKSDLAEAQIAGAPPSRFAALGGYGPQGVPGGAEWIQLPAVGEPYPLTTSRRVIAADGSAYIKGHGDVEKPETAWALLSQLRG